jgi:hypothetical protein
MKDIALVGALIVAAAALSMPHGKPERKEPLTQPVKVEFQ